MVLARDARPAADPGLLLRAAAAAARADLPLSPYTLKVLAVHSPPLPEPWPAEVRWSFLRLLASGRPAVTVLEQLDQEGLLDRLLPEWERVRSLPQRNPWHRFTVDRHLVEAAAAAAELTRDVDRPDLLLVAALLHDIGKGWPGDHSVVGEPVAARIAARMGFARARRRRRRHPGAPPPAAARHRHPPRHRRPGDRRAGRRDDRLRRRPCSSCCTRSPRPTARRPARRRGRRGRRTWWPRSSRGCRPRSARRAAGGHEPVLEPTPPQVTAPLPDPGLGAVTVGVEDVADGQQVTIGIPDRPGVFSLCAGVLALNQLDVRAAKVAIDRRPRDGGLRGPAALRPGAGAADPRRRRARRARRHAAAGRPAAAAGGRLPRRTASGRRRRASRGTTPRSAATPPAIVEVRAADRAGLLLPAHRGAGRRGPRRDRRPGRDARRRRGRLLLRVLAVGDAAGRRAARAGSSAALVAAATGGREPVPAGAPRATRRAEVRGSVSGPCFRGPSGTERSRRTGRGPRGAAPVAVPGLRRRARVRAAAVRRRAHRRRRRVPGVGLRRLRHGGLRRRRRAGGASTPAAPRGLSGRCAPLGTLGVRWRGRAAPAPLPCC